MHAASCGILPRGARRGRMAAAAMLALAACSTGVVRQETAPVASGLSGADRAWVDRTLASLSLR